MLLPLRLEHCTTKNCATNDFAISECTTNDCTTNVENNMTCENINYEYTSVINDELSFSTKDKYTDTTESNNIKSNTSEQWNDLIQIFDQNVKQHLENDPIGFIYSSNLNFF